MDVEEIVNEPMPEELVPMDREELQQSEEALLKHTHELIHDSELPLTFTYPCEFVERRIGASVEWDGMHWQDYEVKNRREHERRETPSQLRTDGPERRGVVKEHGATIATGILWINGPFATDFWSGRRKKPKPTKCICATCGSKHNRK